MSESGAASLTAVAFAQTFRVTERIEWAHPVVEEWGSGWAVMMNGDDHLHGEHG